MALSTTKVEYIAYFSAICEALWIRRLLSYFINIKLEVTCKLCDNQSCVSLFENLVFNDKSKHIEIKYHYIRDMVQRGVVKL